TDDRPPLEADPLPVANRRAAPDAEGGPGVTKELLAGILPRPGLWRGGCHECLRKSRRISGAGNLTFERSLCRIQILGVGTAGELGLRGHQLPFRRSRPRN